MNSTFALLAVVACLCVAAFVLARGPRTFAHRMLAAGMLLLAVERALLAAGLATFSPIQVLSWNRARLLAEALLPGTWLLFSLSFGRANYRDFIRGWKWPAVAAFLLPIVMAAAFADDFLLGATPVEGSRDWMLPIGWSGRLYSVAFLLGSVAVLVNLEKTLRGFTGTLQWQVKFMIAGAMGIFSARICILSISLLYSALNTAFESLGSAALVIASSLMLLSLVRSSFSDVNIYLSRSALYHSVTALLVGLYLLAVGLISGFVGAFGKGLPLPLEYFLLFLALMGLALLLLSAKVRNRWRSWLMRHLKRPEHDYREAWSNFTRRTQSLVDIPQLSAAIARMVSETLDVPSVSLWLLDEPRSRVELSASTAVSVAAADAHQVPRAGFDGVGQAMCRQPFPVDLEGPESELGAAIRSSGLPCFERERTRCCVPLCASGELVGFMTLGGRLSGGPFSLEDLDLLKMIADQAAGSILGLKLSERIRDAKQLEAFQTMSTFFAHDLKNVASTLSLTLRNMPDYLDDPDFRKEALRVIGQSVEKIKTLCSRLSVLRERIDLDLREMDLNGLVRATLAQFNGCLQDRLETDLGEVPPVPMDPEQMQKVLTNLILNAGEASGDDGGIRVTTERHGRWAVLSVGDNGVGMSREFMERSLFQPFRTTKEKGMGIGLFHSKMIVEAHGGRIEVESEEGQGATFRVLLPVG